VKGPGFSRAFLRFLAPIHHDCDGCAVIPGAAAGGIARKSGKGDRDERKLPAVNPHARPKHVETETMPGTGTLPKPGTNDPNGIVPTG